MIYTKKLLLVGFIILLLLLFFFLWREDKGIYAEDKTAIPPAYQPYQPITLDYQADSFQIETVCSTTISSAAAPNPIRVYASVLDNIIVDCYAEKDEDSKGDASYFKINNKGHVTDSLYVKYEGYWTVLIDSFMLHTQEKDAYFTTWPSDGSTERHMLIAHNADLLMPEAELLSALEKIKQQSAYYFLRTYVDDGQYSSATYFYAADHWQVLWQKTASYESEKDSESAARYQQEIYRSGEPDVYLQAGVALEYFHPQDKVKYYHIIGGGAPGTTKVDWRGTGFFRTVVDGSPFLFSIPNMVVEKEKHDGFQTRIYQVDEPKTAVKHINTSFYQTKAGFVLYAPDGKILYVIRKKA